MGALAGPDKGFKEGSATEFIGFAKMRGKPLCAEYLEKVSEVEPLRVTNPP
jgi:hypothetical protein